VSSNIINLVTLRDHVYPVAPEDYRAMIDCGLSTARIPAVSLDIIRHTVLKGQKIKVHAWTDIYSQILSQFEDAVSKTDLLCKTEDRTVIYIIQPNAEAQKSATQIIDQFSQYMSRYSLRVRREAKERADRGDVLWRIRPVFDLEIPNGMFYQDTPPPPTVAALDFKTYRIHLAVEDTGGAKTLAVKTQDMIGKDWVTGTSRSFLKSQLSRTDAYELANFLLSNF